MADVLPWVLIIASVLSALLLAAALVRTLWVLVMRAREGEAVEQETIERNDG